MLLYNSLHIFGLLHLMTFPLDAGMRISKRYAAAVSPFKTNDIWKLENAKKSKGYTINKMSHSLSIISKTNIQNKPHTTFKTLSVLQNKTQLLSPHNAHHTDKLAAAIIGPYSAKVSFHNLLSQECNSSSSCTISYCWCINKDS